MNVKNHPQITKYQCYLLAICLVWLVGWLVGWLVEFWCTLTCALAPLIKSWRFSCNILRTLFLFAKGKKIKVKSGPLASFSEKVPEKHIPVINFLGLIIPQVVCFFLVIHDSDKVTFSTILGGGPAS